MADGPAGFRPGFTCPTVLGCLFERVSPFAYGAFTRCGAAFQELRLGSTLLTLAGFQEPGRGPTTPRAQRPGLGTHAVWAVSRSLAATEDIDGSFSSWGYLDVSIHPVGFRRP